MTENASETAGPASVHLSSGKLAQMIDISAVQAFHTQDDIRSLAGLALKKGLSLVMGCLIRAMIKLTEARSLVEAGADELDMMINLGRLKSGDLCHVRNEIKAVVETTAPISLKVILEVSRLTDDEIRRGSESVVAAGAAFAKTGTGWTGETTTLNHIRIINAVVQGNGQIKASGGIRNLETIKAMLSLGVTRFGINTRVALELIKECLCQRYGSREIHRNQERNLPASCRLVAKRPT
jgi:deoxyribose-phosphate aldolase